MILLEEKKGKDDPSLVILDNLETN